MKAIAIVVLALAAAAGVSAQCSGACQDNSNYCPNAYQQGLCPGPANIECCPEPTPDCSGQCQDTSLPCGTSYQSGLCPGPDNVECCVASSGSGCQGACQDTSNSCPNAYQPGLCPGPANIECCPEPTPNCNGQCQDNSLPCSGSYVAGDCPGPDNVQCCSSSGPSPSGGDCQPFADAQWNCADPSCSSTVPDGSPQPDYGCAEFVSRSLASAGYIPGLGPYDSQGAYGAYTYSNGVTYDLCWTSSKSGGGILGLEDFLEAAGWPNGGQVGDCTVVLVTTDSYESHVVVGVAGNTLDAHNNARYHVDPSFYEINNVYNPPSLFNRTRWHHPHKRAADMPVTRHHRPAQQPKQQHVLKLKP